MCASSIPRFQARTSWEERGAMPAASAGSLPEGEMSQYETGGFALVRQSAWTEKKCFVSRKTVLCLKSQGADSKTMSSLG